MPGDHRTLPALHTRIGYVTGECRGARHVADVERMLDDRMSSGPAQHGPIADAIRGKAKVAKVADLANTRIYELQNAIEFRNPQDDAGAA